MKKKLLKSILAVTSAAGIIHGINKYYFNKAKPMSDMLNGYKDFYFTGIGRMHYARKGTGEPILLIHGIHEGASSFTWRKNFDELSQFFTVYSIDLPGFGNSEKLPITYRAYMYREAIKAFIKDLIGEPVYAIACLQSAAYVIQIAYETPDLFKKIIAVSPTGIFESSLSPERKDVSKILLYKSPILGTFIYNALRIEASTKNLLKTKIYYNKDNISKQLVNDYKNNSRQGKHLSKYAPASYFAGYLNQNIINAVIDLRIPLKVFWGRESKINPINNLNNFIDLNSSIEFYIFEKCGVFPQEEYPNEFNTLCKNFFFNKKTG